MTWPIAGMVQVRGLRYQMSSRRSPISMPLRCTCSLSGQRASSEARWKHLASLPQCYDSTFFWSDSELEGLNGSPWLELARRFATEVESDWLALLNSPARAFISERGISKADYQWAYATLKSRSAEAVVGGVAGSRLMAPGFDLFNHSDALTPGMSHYYSEERQQLIIVASYDHGAGEQAFISYGTASNGSLLLAGGFVLPSNRFDYVEVPLTSLVDSSRLNTYMMAAPDATETSQAKLATFEFLQVPTEDQVTSGEAGCAPFTTRHLLTLEEPLPIPLLTYVRLDRLTDEELAAHTRRAAKEAAATGGGGTPLYDLVRGDKALDAMNELLSLGALRGTLASLLAGYPTTLEEDEARLLAAAPPLRVPGKSSGDEASAAAAKEAAAEEEDVDGRVVLSERARSALLLVANEKRIASRRPRGRHRACARAAQSATGRCHDAGGELPQGEAGVVKYAHTPSDPAEQRAELGAGPPHV